MAHFFRKKKPPTREMQAIQLFKRRCENIEALGLATTDKQVAKLKAARRVINREAKAIGLDFSKA